MAIQFVLPKLGESVEAGVVVAIPVEVGDTVEENQTLLEVETDKAIAEVPADFSGVITEIHVGEGDEIKPGQPIVTYEESAGEAAEKADDERVEGADETDTGGDGEAITASAPEHAEAADEAGRIAAASRSMAAAPEADITKPTHPIPVLDALSPDSERALLPAAPSTRRFAREIGIDLRLVPGTGPGGRISIDDVKQHSKDLNEGRAAQPVGGAQIVQVVLPDFNVWGETERKPMRGVRRATAEHLSQVWATVPHVTQFDKADVTELEKMRKQFVPRVEKHGAKLTVTGILLKVIAAALKQFPQFNSSVDMANKEIIYKNYFHVGIAVDTEHGLMVPVIRDVDQKNLTELSVELGVMAEKTRDRKLSADDMQGGCFTISNLGGIGGTHFTPIINAPEVAILGVARTQVEARYIDGQFEPRQMLPLALSYDHRVIDGADGIRFLRWVIEALENPFVLTLEG